MVQTPSSIFPQYTQELCPRIESALRRYLEFGPGCPAQLREAIAHSLLAPCKRLRPVLVLLATETCGLAPEKALPAACAVEMVHTYSLIHDDLPAMDDDDMRRGLPSCHAKYGVATAILAGDALLALAFEVLAAGVTPPETAARCCVELAKAAGPTQLVAGQADDLAAEQNGVGELDFLQAIHHRKTGAMFRVSLRLGGLIAQADTKQLAALDVYGKSLGLAFQIIDDLLDLQGDESLLGKRTRKDSGRGKLTFPGLLGAEESRRQAISAIEQACSALVIFGEAANSLEALARYVLERNH